MKDKHNQLHKKHTCNLHGLTTWTYFMGETIKGIKGTHYKKVNDYKVSYKVVSLT